MKFVRFLKIFAICLGGLIGVTGISMGIMYLAGYFDTKTIYPEQIAFVQTEYQVDGDFKMMINTPTEDANALDVTLSFDGIQSSGDTISDGVISVPKYVKIGKEFDVKIVKSPQVLNGQTVDWINGGISKLVATCENINARKAMTQVFVDVPVFDINVKTSVSSDFDDQNLQSDFNVDSEFFALAEFVPAKSAYKYSRDTEYGGQAQYKSVFFSTLSNAISTVETDNLDRYIKKFKAIAVTDGAQIVAQAFANSKTENDAYDAVSNFDDPDLKYNNLLSILQNAVDTQKAVSKTERVNVKQLLVGNFAMDTTKTVPARYNQSTKIYANKSSLGDNEYSLDAKIFATDNQTLLSNQITKLGLIVLKQTGTGYELAKIYTEGEDNSDADIFVLASARKQASVLNFADAADAFLPVENRVNVNQSYWEIAPLKENLNLHFAIVLFDQDFAIRDFSFKNLTTRDPKFIFDIQSVQVISNQVYWTNPLNEEKSLYVYDGATPAENVAEEYDLKRHQIFVGDNTYTQTKYFAYLELSDGTIVNPNKGDAIDPSKNLSNFVATAQGRIYNANISSGINALLYELPDGVVKALYNSEELDGKIKVLFATLKTDFAGNILKDADGNFVVDRYGSNSTVGCQTMTFVTKKTLVNVKAQVALETGDNKAYFDEELNLFAVKINTADSFDILFDLQPTQQKIFKRDFDEGKIIVDFFVNGKKDNDMFVTVPTVDGNVAKLTVTVGEFDYEPNDTGYRNILIKINYVRGSGNVVTTEVTNYYDEKDANKQSGVLQVYDGKISSIGFVDFEKETPAMQNNSEQNPIIVSTNLQGTAGQDGIFVAEAGSSYSVKLDNDDVSDDLFDENKIAVIAKDKYGKQITEAGEDLYWELVSSNEDILKVNNTTKTITFVKSSTETVSLKVRTYKAAGMGNNVIECKREIFFKVETGGRIVRVQKQTINSDDPTVVFDNVERVEENGALIDKFKLKDNQKNFSETSLEIEVLGKSGESFDLSELVKIFYGLEAGDNTFEVFDLKDILQWTRIDKANLNDFVTFRNKDKEVVAFETDPDNPELVKISSENISSFTITKNFGTIGYMNLRISSEIGVNLSVNITIKPFIEASITNTYSHEEQGASSLAEGNITYLGVYAKEKITVTFKLNFPNADANATHKVENVVWYVCKDNGQRIAISNRIGKTFNNNDDDGKTFEIDYTFDDVTANTKYKMTVVLDTSGQNADADFNKLAYDYFADIYFYVNPNVQCTLKDGEDTDNDGKLDTKRIGAYQNELVKNILKTDDTVTDNVIDVKRIAGTESLSFDKGTKPYVYVQLVNENGNKEDNYRFFELEGNTLKIKNGQLLDGKQNVFVGVFFGNGENSARDLRLCIYNFVVTPSLSENIELKDKDNEKLKDKDGEDLDQKMGFVQYDGQTYLQLLTEKTYALEDIAQCFEVKNESGQYVVTSVTAEFDSEYVNQTRYWTITNSTITIVSNINALVIDQLFVKLTIQGVGTIKYPILITPQLALYVNYENDNPNNDLANKDLYINQTASELAENDIYDIVQDSNEINVFASEDEGKTNGIKKIANASYTFEIKDENGNNFVNNFASIDENGNLKLDAIGEDKIVIIVAKVAGFNILYRIKIVSSLKLEVFYPYIQNFDQTGKLYEDRAEYVLFANDDADQKSINLTEGFSSIIPAYSQKITLTKQEEKNVTQRFMLFRYDNEAQTREQEKQIESLEFSIKNIQSGSNVLRDIAPALWGQYAVVETSSNTTSLTLSKMGNYVVTIQVCANNGANAEYVVRVELSSKKYTLVQSKSLDGQNIDDITQMPNLPADDIVISSPEKGEKQEYSLEYIKLKMLSGSTGSDKTDELGYLIVDRSEKLSFDDKNKKIVCEYTANDINAQIIFFTKYGEIGRRNIKVNSVTKVLEKADGGTETVNGEAGYKLAESKILYSGQTVKLGDLFVIAVKNAGGTWEKQEATYTKIIFDKAEQPSWLVYDEQKIDEFVILPLKEGVQESLTVTAHCNIGGDAFKYTIYFDIQSGITSKKPASLDPVLGDVVIAGKERQISVFDELFEVKNAIKLDLDENRLATAPLDNDQQDIKYTFTYEVQSGTDVLDLDSIAIDNNVFKVKTNATASDVTVKIRFVLALEYNSHRFEAVCFYQFVVTPDSDVVVNYPNINGQEFEREKLYVDDEFCLDKEPIFGQEGTNRVQVKPKEAGVTPEIKVYYEIVQGSVRINSPAQSQDGYNLNQEYDFEFGEDSSFALVEFKIFVSGLQRATYSLELYKNFNSLYSVNVQTLNEKEDLSEVFYIAEGRRDIFNGPQAFKFIVANVPSLLATTKKFEYFAGSTLLGEFELDAACLGQNKTIILPYQNGLESLNLNNLRFRINGDDSKFYTLDDLSSGETAYFTKNASGKVNFEIFSRIRIQYLGIDVTDFTDFMQNNIMIVGNDEGSANTNAKNFNVEYDGLGWNEGDDVCKTEIEKSLKIAYRNESNVLGSYYYKVKSDLQVLNKDTIQITAGENIDKLLSVFGVVDHNKNAYVDYKNGTIYQISDQIKNKNLILELDFKNFNQSGGNKVSFVYLDTRQKYEFNNFSPMTRSDKVMKFEDGTSAIYDFEIVAYGAPNSGLYSELVFKWTYKVSDDEELTFMQTIPVEIQSNVQIELKNLDGSSNSTDNPQKISSELYTTVNGETLYNLVLIDKKNVESALVNAYKINTSTTENFAYDLSYVILNANSDTCQIKSTEQTKELLVYKPAFSVKDIQVQLSDSYGYTKIYYLQAQPSNLISFVQLTEGQVFENDTFVLKTGSETSDADHEIVLSTTQFEDDCLVSYRLLAADGTDLSGISNSNLVGVGTMLRFNTLDSTVFSASTKSVYCYLEITLKCQDENYVINSTGFSLRQRYSSTVVDQSARDGVEFELKDKVAFFDNKIDGTIAKPLLFDEKTLVVDRTSDICELGITAKLKNGSATKPQVTISNEMLESETVENETVGKKAYVMMNKAFNANWVENYDFYVRAMKIRINDTYLKLTVDGTKLNSELLDKDGNKSSGQYSYQVLLFDGKQYVICDVSNVNTNFDFSNTKAYQDNAIFGIVGYENGKKPKVSIETKTIANNHYETQLVIDPNGYDQSSYEATYEFENVGDLGGFDKRYVSLTKVLFKTENQAEVSVTVNGIKQSKSVTKNTDGKYYVVLTPEGKTTVSNVKENWLLTKIPYNEQANIRDDKRLEIVTVEKFGEADNCEFSDLKLSSTISDVTIDGGKLKFKLTGTEYKIENVYVEATKDGVSKQIFPQNFEKIASNQYAFRLSDFGLQNYTKTDFAFYVQTLKNKNTEEISVQIFNPDKNLTQDLILAGDQSKALDVSQGRWDKILDKQNAQEVEIELSGGKKVTVKLDRNGKQEFSLLQQGLDEKEVQNASLEDKNYEDQFAEVEFFDDTLGFKVYSINSGSGSLKFVLSRLRNGEQKDVDITISLYSYDHTYYIGLTDKFGEMPKTGDVYSLKYGGGSKSYDKNVEFFVPYEDITCDAEICTVDAQARVVTLTMEDKTKIESNGVIFRFTMNEMVKIEKTSIKFDSKGQYETKAGTQKYMSVDKYYLAKYRGAYYEVKPNFKLSPYFFGLNLDKVPSKESNYIAISDYTQTKDGEYMSYTISLANWANGIRFNDVNGDVIKKSTNEDVWFKDNTDKLHCTVISDESDDQSAGSGNASINKNFDITLTLQKTSAISDYHVTLKIQVSLGGETENENSNREWLEIGSITLIFNSKNQYQIPYNSKYVIANRYQTSSGDDSETFFETFRFVAYGNDNASSGENLSFSASRLFDDQTIVDMSQVRTMIKDENKIYLLESDEANYQLSYNMNETTKVAVVAKSAKIANSERQAFVYGLTSGEHVKITAKASKDTEDYVYATYTTDRDVYYGTVRLSDLDWYKDENQETTKVGLPADYNYFEIDNLYTDKCCIPLSYVDLDNLYQTETNKTSFKSISNFYDASKYGGDEAQRGLIANDEFWYSKTFELAKLEDANLKNVKVALPANSVKYFQVSQNDTNGNVYSQIKKVENEKPISAIVDVDIESSTGLGTFLGVVIKDITTTGKSGADFDLSSISFLQAKQGIYKICFNDGDKDFDFQILKYYGSNTAMPQFEFLKYLYNKQNQVLDAAKDNEKFAIKMILSQNFALTACQTVTNDNGTYSYSNYNTLNVSKDSFKNANVVITAFDTTNLDDKTQLVWHEYMDKESKTGYLYYCQDGESKAVSADDFRCQIGKTITLLWDGTKTIANIENGKTYVLKVVTNDGTADVENKYLFVAKNDNSIKSAFDIKTILQGLGLDTTTMPLRDKVEILSNADFVYTALESNAYYFVKYDDVKKAIVYFDSENLQKLQNICAILGMDYAHIDKIGFEKATDFDKAVQSGYYLVKTSNKNVIVKVEQDGVMNFCAMKALDGKVYDFFENGFVDALTVSKIETNFRLQVSDTLTDAYVKIVCAGMEKFVSVSADQRDREITINLDEEFIKSLDIQKLEDGLKIKFINWNKENNAKESGQDAFEKEFPFVEAKDFFA